jgi:hypothetical protein
LSSFVDIFEVHAMSIGSIGSTTLKSFPHFPQKINIPWEGSKIPFQELKRLARISHCAKTPESNNSDGLLMQVWVENQDKFIGQYERNRVQTTIAGDIEALPKRPKIKLREHDSIPVVTPVDRKLDHLRRVAKTAGRNNDNSAADFCKVRIAAFEGGFTGDIRRLHPVELYGWEPERYYLPLFGDVERIPAKRKVKFMRIPPEPYAPIQDSKWDLLGDAYNGVIANFLITRPGTKATEDLKNRLALRNSLDFTHAATNPEGYVPYHAIDLKRMAEVEEKLNIDSLNLNPNRKRTVEDEGILNVHPLHLSHRFDQRRAEKAQQQAKRAKQVKSSHPKKKSYGQYQNRFDQERLPSLGTVHVDENSRTPQGQRAFTSMNRTGRWLHDILSLLPPRERKSMFEEAEQILKKAMGEVFEGGSIGQWASKLPSPKAQDDFEINYRPFSPKPEEAHFSMV